MQYSQAKIRKLSDDRLLNAILYKDTYNYPFDYVEMCKEELRRRGYTNRDIQAEIDLFKAEGFIGGDTPLSRFELVKRIKLRSRFMAISAVLAPAFFLLVFLAPKQMGPDLTRLCGALGLATGLAFFLAVTNRSALKARLADRDAENRP